MCLLAVCATAIPSRITSAQTVYVDVTPGHATNHFIPSQTLGAGIDRIPTNAIDQTLNNPATLKQVLSAGWQPVTYRQNTDLQVEAWHWNPTGTWSDPSKKQGYFTGSPTPAGFIRYSYGYALPHRGDDSGSGYSRLTDGDTSTYWKSDPYLASRFTGESDALHPQWAVIDLRNYENIDTIRIHWASPYATRYLVQYWTGRDPFGAPTQGTWVTFPHGQVDSGKGGIETIHLTDQLISIRFIRILMTKSSNTCDTHGFSDPRNCVGYAVNELYVGTTTPDGEFHDLLRHTADREHTFTLTSSVDSWHTSADMLGNAGTQLGFDLFYKSGITQGLPAIVPIAMVYDNPDNAAAEIKYLEARYYAISYVEMGEEVDGQNMSPEDYGALYLEFATALHRVDPNLKLGGPSFQGENTDILFWPDKNGNASWLSRFLEYLKSHDRMRDLSFFSFEHYPYDPCLNTWDRLYAEPQLVANIMRTWYNDGVPATMPMLITESNLSPRATESMMDIFGGLWLADYIGSFLDVGGSGVYYFHYLPLKMEQGCDGSQGTFGMFTVHADYSIQQPLSQYFASRMINYEWLQHDGGRHTMFPSTGTYNDGAGHTLVTSYAVQRPDGIWSVMLVNRDQHNAHRVGMVFKNSATKTENYFSGTVHAAYFGPEQYKWHPAQQIVDPSHFPLEPKSPLQQYKPGYAEPDGPIKESTLSGDKTTEYELPASSIVVLRGKLNSDGK
jgi:F5/8 type C domain